MQSQKMRLLFVFIRSIESFIGKSYHYTITVDTVVIYQVVEDLTELPASVTVVK